MVRIVLILLFFGCTTDNKYLETPPDTKKAIQDLQEISVLQSDQNKKERVIKALNDCGVYSIEAYNKYIQCVKESSSLREKIESLQKEISQLEEEIKPWRWIKRSFYLIVIGLVIFYLIKLYLKFKPI